MDCDARRLGQAIRIHWSVENGLHWTMEVTFGYQNGMPDGSCVSARMI